MKKVTAFIGSAQKKGTYYAMQEFERNLKRLGEVDFQYVFLNDHRLEFCQGCKLCFDKGEDFCPLKDDKDTLLTMIEESDGVIFAAPNYAFQVSARMKNFFDRTAYIIHRPRFFGKTFTSVVTQGFTGGKRIRKYMESVGVHLGFNVTMGCYVQTLEPMTESMQRKLKLSIKKASEKFHKELLRSVPPVPSMFSLMYFRLWRTSLQAIDVRLYDYYYFSEKGWFETDYYYETPLGPIKKLAGQFFDFLGRRISKYI